MTIFRSSANFYDNPELYDLACQGSREEFDFYLGEARRLGGPVLELACGTGRLTNELAAHGIECDGLDLSEAMLKHAEYKAKSRALSVRYFLGDMTDFILGRKYQMIFVPINSLLHLHTLDKILKFFECARLHLAGGGELIFSIFVPSPKILASDPKKRHFARHFTDPTNGKEVLLEESIHYDASTQISYSTWYYSYFDEKDVFSHPLTVKSIFPQELETIIRLADFKILHKYGDYAKAAFGPASRYQIVSCAPMA